MAEPHVFDALYLVIGTVNRNGAPNPADGRKVVFYQSYPDVVRATVGPPLSASGKFALNIYDNDQVPIRQSETYYVAVERDPVDGWGADPVAMTITNEGWSAVTLDLALGAGPGGPTEGPDDGLINNTTIIRMPDGTIKVLWSYNGAANADVWRMDAGADKQFSATTTGYNKLNPAPLVATDFIDPTLRVSDGATAYYRVVPGGVVQTDIFGTDPVTGRAYNKRTVGKVDLRLRDEYNAVCYPFNSAYIDLPAMLGSQLAEGDQVHWWDQPAQQYRIITKPAGAWPATHNFALGDGFLIYLVPGTSARDIKLTLVGLVDNFATGITKPLPLKYTMVGYPYPVLRDATGAGFAAREQDQIHLWRWDGQRYYMSTYVGGVWNDLSLINFTVGESKFYYIPEDKPAYDWAPIF